MLRWGGGVHLETIVPGGRTQVQRSTYCEVALVRKAQDRPTRSNRKETRGHSGLEMGRNSEVLLLGLGFLPGVPRMFWN